MSLNQEGCFGFESSHRRIPARVSDLSGESLLVVDGGGNSHWVAPVLDGPKQRRESMARIRNMFRKKEKKREVEE